MKKVYILSIKNSKDSESGITQHSRELYNKFPQINFIEYFLIGDTTGKDGNVERRKFNKKEITKIKGSKIILTSFTRRMNCLKNNIKLNDLIFIDHGTWPKNYIDKSIFLKVPLSKKIWAYWNFLLNRKMMEIIENSKIISFSEDDLNVFKTSKEKFIFVPYFDLPKIEKTSKKYDWVNPARPSLQKNTMNLLKYFNKFEKIIIFGKNVDRKRAIIKVLNNSQVLYLGEIPSQEASKYISAAKNIILVSNWEGFPRVIIEGLLAGSKVYTTKSFYLCDELHKEGFIKLIDSYEGWYSEYQYDPAHFNEYIHQKIEASNNVFEKILQD